MTNDIVSTNSAGLGGVGASGSGGNGGGIYNDGSLSVADSLVTGNRAGSDGGSDGSSAGTGGNGGGIFSDATLTLLDCMISDNQAGSGDSPASLYASPVGGGGNGGNGGGIYSTATLTLARVRMVGNQAGAGRNPAWPDESGGRGGNGGGIDAVSVVFTGGEINSNRAGEGGTGDDGSITQNGAPGGSGGAGGDGGGIYVSGPATLANIAIISNRAGNGRPGGAGGEPNSGSTGGTGGASGDGGSGGGIYCGGVLVLTNVTVAANQAGAGAAGMRGGTNAGADPGTNGGKGGDGGDGGSGGGIYDAGMPTLINDTISDNSFGTGGSGGPGGAGTSGGRSGSPGSAGVAGSGGGVFQAASVAVHIVIGNAIIAGNEPPTSGADLSLATTVASRGHNLIGIAGGTSGWLASDQTGTTAAPLDPKLSSLAHNGGPTQTMALLPGSPAIDAGSNALALGPDGKPLLTDQRGYARIVNGIVDIGAYEFGSSIPGDANADGTVDFKDLVILASHYGQQSGATFAQGDFNGDGKVDFADLVILAQYYGRKR